MTIAAVPAQGPKRGSSASSLGQSREWRADERTADRLDMAGYAAVQGIRATARVAGADEADWA